MYVANLANNTVSVINETNNKKIGNDIKVGNKPIAIGVNSGKVYVANSANNTVSVINETNNKKIGNDIKVGKGPSAIGVTSGKVYVANSDDNTVSVINETNNAKIADIKVGKGPKAIGVDAFTNTIYVVNSDDNTVSVIDEKANKVVAGVTFNVKPFNAGRIECDKNNSSAPVDQQFYLWSGSECVAKPNHGFEFVSWQENLKGNSTQLLKVATTSSFFDPVLNILHLMSDKPESTLNITRFGSFTANFKALPPAIPPEYVATLFAIVATAVVGSWLIPSIIGWISAKKQGSRLDHYHNEVKTLYDDRKLDKNDIEKLNNLRDRYCR